MMMAKCGSIFSSMPWNHSSNVSKTHLLLSRRCFVSLEYNRVIPYQIIRFFPENFQHTILVTALCSEGSMFRRFYVLKIFVQKVTGYMFRRFYIQKVLCSEGPIFRRSYVQKVLCSESICSKGPIFRRFYV